MSKSLKLSCFDLLLISHSSAFWEPKGEGTLVDLAKSIGLNHSSGGAVHDSRGGITSAWDNCSNFGLVRSKRKSNPRSSSHGAVEASFFLITTDDDDLDVLLVFVPSLVKLLQVGLERGACTSPACGIHHHDQLVALDGFSSVLATIGIYEFASEEITHF